MKSTMKKAILALVALGIIPTQLLFANMITSNLLANPGAEAGSIVDWTPAGPGSPGSIAGRLIPALILTLATSTSSDTAVLLIPCLRQFQHSLRG
jgi:hypothetical protein